MRNNPEHKYHQELLATYPATLNPNFKVGDRVEVISGPYKGLVSSIFGLANQWNGCILEAKGGRWGAYLNWRELKRTKKAESLGDSFDEVAFRLYPILRK